MDFVPRRHRGKVNAVDGVRSFSWSGSAALGGFLIERFGFQPTFLITAAIKTAAFLPLLLLLRYVPDGVGVPGAARAARLAALPRWEAPTAKPAGGAAAAARDGGLREPRLARGPR